MQDEPECREPDLTFDDELAYRQLDQRKILNMLSGPTICCLNPLFVMAYSATKNRNSDHGLLRRFSEGPVSTLCKAEMFSGRLN